MKRMWQNKIAHPKFDVSSPLLRTLFVAALVLFVVGAYHLYKYIWPTPYVAKPSGFQIVFPGAPSVDKLPSQTKAGVRISGRLYSVDNQSKGTDYAVYATNYAGINFSSYARNSKINTLESEVQTIAKNDQLNVSAGQTTTFQNMVAVEATLAPSDPSLPDTHVLAFLNRSRLYVLLGAGMSVSKFNAYTKTFHFINS